MRVALRVPIVLVTFKIQQLMMVVQRLLLIVLSQAATLLALRVIILPAHTVGVRAAADTRIKETKILNVYPSSC